MSIARNISNKNLSLPCCFAFSISELVNHFVLNIQKGWKSHVNSKILQLLEWSLRTIINVFLSCIIEMIAINGNKQAIVPLTIKNKFNGTVLKLTGININRWFVDEMHVNFILISLWSRLRHQVFCARETAYCQAIKHYPL